MPKPRSEQISPQTTTTTKTTSTPILENTKLTRPFEFLEIGTKKTSSLLITPTDVKDHVVEDEPGPSLGTDDIRRSGRSKIFEPNASAAINTKSLIQPITENNSIIPEITGKLLLILRVILVGPQRRDWAVNPISSFADIKEFIEQHFTMKGWDDAGPEVLQTCMWMGNIILNTTKMNPGELTMRNVMNWAFSLVLRNFWEVENTLLRDIYIRVCCSYLYSLILEGFVHDKLQTNANWIYGRARTLLGRNVRHLPLRPRRSRTRTSTQIFTSFPGKKLIRARRCA